MKSKQIHRVALSVALVSSFGIGSVQAEENMRFQGTLIAPVPCIINADQIIQVNFGDELATNKIDGLNYIKDIEYTLDCRNAGANTVKMQIQGTGASFDQNVLATIERSELGIALKTNSATQLNVNSWLNVQFGTTPRLRAVPVKATGSQLQPGAFTAGATMLIEYQ